MIARKDIESLIGSGFFLFIATLIVNAANYGLNLILGRVLGPELYAEANMIATLVMILSFIAMGLQLTVAKLYAEGQEKLVGLLHKRVKVLSYLLVIACCASTVLLMNFLQFERWYALAILFLGIPLYLLMSMGRGVYQGKRDFKNLAKTYLVEMLVRVVVTIGLLLLLMETMYKTEAVAIGFLVSFFVTYYCSRVSFMADKKVDKQKLNTVFSFLSVIVFYELSQILINNSDVILVKHYFTAQEAGLYSSMALLGRAVFFATWSLVTVLFPKVIEKENKGESHLGLFWSSLMIVASIGGSMVLGSYLFGEQIMLLAFGRAYVSVSNYLWLYCLLTTMFACANVFVYYYMSLGKYIPVFISILIGFLQIYFLTVYHSDLAQVLFVQLALMLVMLLSMVVYQRINLNSRLSKLSLERSIS